MAGGAPSVLAQDKADRMTVTVVESTVVKWWTTRSFPGKKTCPESHRYLANISDLSPGRHLPNPVYLDTASKLMGATADYLGERFQEDSHDSFRGTGFSDLTV